MSLLPFKIVLHHPTWKDVDTLTPLCDQVRRGCFYTTFYFKEQKDAEAFTVVVRELPGRLVPWESTANQSKAKLAPVETFHETYNDDME